MIHIDIDPTSISKNVKVNVPIVGDVKQVLNALLDELEQVAPDGLAKPEKWWEQINQWRAKKCLSYEQKNELPKGQFVIEKLWEVTNGDAYIASDVGQHQMWAAQYYRFDKPMRWINSGGLGTMGFGLPAAMGVQMAHPDAQVVCISGDGSIQCASKSFRRVCSMACPLRL